MDRIDSPFVSILGVPKWDLTSRPLTPEQIGTLPLAAARLVLSHSTPLEALEHLSQNFPLYSHALVFQTEIQFGASNGTNDEEDDVKIKQERLQEEQLGEIWNNRRMWDALLGIKPGAPVPPSMKREGRFWLNGREISDQELNVFE